MRTQEGEAATETDRGNRKVREIGRQRDRDRETDRETARQSDRVTERQRQGQRQGRGVDTCKCYG